MRLPHVAFRCVSVEGLFCWLLFDDCVAQLADARGELGAELEKRRTKMLSTTFRRWREMQLQRGLRAWMSNTFMSKVCFVSLSSADVVLQVDQLRSEQAQSHETDVMSRILAHWQERQLQAGFRTWQSKTFQSKVRCFHFGC